MIQWIKRLICRHQDLVFVRNIYGDEIIHTGYKRSIWICDTCTKLILKDEIHEPSTKGES